MINNYTDFIATCSSKRALYAQIPDDHLTFTGTKTFELYKIVMFNAAFADSADELLALLKDEDMASVAEYAPSEHRQVMRCLNRLAEAEAANPTCETI